MHVSFSKTLKFTNNSPSYTFHFINPHQDVCSSSIHDNINYHLHLFFTRVVGGGLNALPFPPIEDHRRISSPSLTVHAELQTAEAGRCSPTQARLDSCAEPSRPRTPAARITRHGTTERKARGKARSQGKLSVWRGATRGQPKRQWAACSE